MTTNDIGSAIGEVAHFKELSSDEHVFGLTIDTAAKQFIVSTSSRRSFMFYVSTETFEIQMIQQNVGSNLYGLASDVEGYRVGAGVLFLHFINFADINFFF